MFVDLAAAVFVISCLTVAIVVCIDKWGVRTLYETRVKGVKVLRWRIGELCDFCLCFWVSFFNVWVAFQLFEISLYFTLVPFPSAAFSFFIYANIRAKI